MGKTESRASRQQLESIRLRDPFILSVPEHRKYYLFGTGWTLPNGPGLMVYPNRTPSGVITLLVKKSHATSVFTCSRMNFC